MTLTLSENNLEINDYLLREYIFFYDVIFISYNNKRSDYLNTK